MLGPLEPDLDYAGGGKWCMHLFRCAISALLSNPLEAVYFFVQKRGRSDGRDMGIHRFGPF